MYRWKTHDCITVLGQNMTRDTCYDGGNTFRLKWFLNDEAP